MTSFVYDVIDPCDLIWIPTKYGSIHHSNAENVPPSVPILYIHASIHIHPYTGSTKEKEKLDR